MELNNPFVKLREELIEKGELSELFEGDLGINDVLTMIEEAELAAASAGTFTVRFPIPMNERFPDPEVFAPEKFPLPYAPLRQCSAPDTV